MASAQVHAGFVRNRRFLIAVSIGLACVKWLDLHFTKISILGNEAEIQNQALVSILEWTVWAWACLQYVVWFNDVGAAAKLRRAIVAECERRLGQVVEKEPLPDWVLAHTTEEIRNRQPVLPPLTNDKFRYEATYTGMHGSSEKIADIQVVAVTRVPDQFYEERSSALRFERVITAEEWKNQWRMSQRHVLLTRRFVLEYFAPFVIALLPVLAAALPVVIGMLLQVRT